jgi:hypothetical protein
MEVAVNELMNDIACAVDSGDTNRLVELMELREALSEDDTDDTIMEVI